MLAKTTAGVNKPNGLTMLPRSSLPGPLAELRLTDLPGISKRIITLWVEPLNGHSWGDWSPVRGTDDTAGLCDVMLAMWNDAPKAEILQVGVRLESLEPRDPQLPLFPAEQRCRDLMCAVDLINLEGGADTMYIGTMHGDMNTAPRRISFGQPPSLELPDFNGEC